MVGSTAWAIAPAASEPPIINDAIFFHTVVQCGIERLAIEIFDCLVAAYDYVHSLAACGEIGRHDHVMFAVADQPYVQEDELFGFIHMYKRSYKGIGVLCWKGEMGNPVIFQGQFVPELMALTGDVGGKAVVKEHLSEVFQYEADSEMSLRDIDIPGK